MAGPFGGAQHLVDEAFGPRRAGAADAPWPNAKIAIALAHGRAANRSLRPTVPETPLKLMANYSIAARDPTPRHAERQAIRSEERRVRTECVSTCRSQWSP